MVNFVTLRTVYQPTAEQSRPQPEREHRKRGRKISKAKRDQLRAAGKCFQCEETGHDQRNCPKLHAMRRPAIHAGNIDIARLERLSNRKNEADLRVNAMAFDLEGAISEDTDAVRQAYELRAVEWGRDDRWLDPETRAESRYGIYQFDTGTGMLVEIFDELQPEIGTLEVAATRFRLG